MKLAVVDATANDPAQPLCAPSSSRYAIPIANAPLVWHVFAELAAAGVDHARVVTRAAARQDIGRILGLGEPWAIEVSYVDAPEPDARVAVLSELLSAVTEGPVVLHPGDGMFRNQIAEMLRLFTAGDVDAVLPAQASVHPLKGPAQRRASDMPLVLGSAARPLLEDLLSPESEGEDLIAALLHSDCRLSVCEERPHWAYDESTGGLLAANRMVLDELVASVERDHSGEQNRFEGRISISSSAFVSNCVLNGPISIDDHAVLEDSFIGPYTAIGAGAILSGAEIDNSMVLAGAEIRQPGYRIEASIIGEHAHVTRSFELPKGLHLRLGPESRITLS